MYYVYLHITKDTGIPFYVGKGKDRRAYSKQARSKHWHNTVLKSGYTIEFIETNLSHEEAVEKEIFWIIHFGRKDLGKGTLVNFTDGGEGTAGRLMNEKTKKIISECNRNRPPSEIQKKIIGSLFKGKFGIKHNRSVKVVCKETGQVFGSMAEAERILSWGQGSVCWSIKHNKPIFGLTFERVLTKTLDAL